jgi:hypothetical protein
MNGTVYRPAISSPTISATNNQVNNTKAVLTEINGRTYTATVQILTKLKQVDAAAFAGGKFHTGQNVLVGEAGPEAFVSNAGQISMLGKNGPEVKHFQTSGYVIPAHVTASGVNDGTVPEKYMAAIAGGTATATRERTVERTTAVVQDNRPIEQHIHIGSIQQATEFDVISTVKKAMREAERERRERG